MSRSISTTLALVSISLSLLLPQAACSEPSPQSGKGFPASKETGNGLGIFFKKPNAKRFEFFPWESEETLNGLIWDIKYKPGAEIVFAPGIYVIEQRIFVNEVPDLRMSGMPGTRLVFAAGPDKTDTNTNPINRGDTFIHVEHPERFKVDWRYQLYKADGRGDRVLEFVVKSVLEDRLELTLPAHFMPHVKEIPSGCQIMEELNFFRVRRCPNFVLENLEMDGLNRGGIRGHTNYCGIYATGLYKEHERPTTLGFEIRGCRFKNLKGRGLVFYGMGDVLIENNYFENIRAQAMEIDHFSSGHIRNNYVNGAEVGVMVNDAFESIVEGNVLTNCGHGVRFLMVYPDDWVNTGNIIRDNRIGPGCKAGVHFFSKGLSQNVVTGNTFIGFKNEHKVINGAGNTIELE